MSFPKYEAYKDSGVEWLGEVPEHWGVAPLKHLVSTPVTDGPHETPNFIDDGVLFISAEAVSSGRIDFTKAKYISQEDNHRFSRKYKPQKNDIYMVKSGATTGVVAIVDTDNEFNIWSPLAAIRCKKSQNPYFVLFSMRSRSFQESVVLNWSFGTQQNIGMSVIENLPITNPPLIEQTKIAHFLNHETARIDGLIAEQQRLIELLKEKRQAVISHAVTKGLDPTAPMKDSGVEWLGEVPAHWDLMPAKRFFRLVTEPAAKNNNHELLSVYTDIGVRPRKELEQKGNKASTTDGYWHVKKGDIVVNKLLAWMGAVGYSNYDGVTSPAYDILRPNRELSSKFYHYLFREKIAQQEFKRWSRGIMEMRLRLYFDELGRILMPFPPPKEQREVVHYIETVESQFNALSQAAFQQIKLLQERRSALISAAVTGKIDVRGWQPPASASHTPNPEPIVPTLPR